MKIKINSILVILVIALLCQAAIAREPKVEMNADMNKVADAPTVYYTYAAAPSREVVNANAVKVCINLNKQFNADLSLDILSGNPSDIVSIRDNGKQFNVFNPATEGFIYTKSLTGYLKPDTSTQNRSGNLLDDAVCRRTVLNYLSRLDIIPSPRNEMYIARISKVQMANSVEMNVIYDKMQVVYIGRKLNNVPVFGASRIVVRLGSEGELVSVIKNWPQLEKQNVAGAKKMRGRAEWKDLTINHVKTRHAGTRDSAVNIDSIELVMYDDGEAFVEPALMVLGSVLSETGESNPCDWIVPLLAAPKANYHTTTAAESGR